MYVLRVVSLTDQLYQHTDSGGCCDYVQRPRGCIFLMTAVILLTLRRPLLPYGFSYKAPCARSG